MAINKIIKYGLEEEANSLKLQGLSYAQIAKELSEQSGKQISKQNVYNYFKQNNDPVVKNVKQREEIVTKAINGRLDTIQQLLEINRETYQILQEVKASGDHKTALKAIERIEKQLELQAKLIGDIKEGPVTFIWNVVRVDVPDAQNAQNTQAADT